MIAAYAVAIRWRPFRLPMRAAFVAAHGKMDDRSGVLVELVDAQGRRGVGEASPIAAFGGGTRADVLALLERLDLASADVRDGAPQLAGAGSAALRCAIDVAAIDLEARVAGTTVAALLCDDPLTEVPVNAVVGDGPSEEIARVGVEAVARGYRVLKLKVGAGPLAADCRRVAALREACPDVTIHLDANGAWDEATALDAVRELAPLRIAMLEQPVARADVGALARISARSSIPIGADEAMIDLDSRERVLLLGAAGCVVLKPMVLGGLRPALEVGRQAAARGMRVIVTTTFDSSIGTAASLALAASLPAGISHGLSTGEHLAADVVARSLVPTRGMLALPAGREGVGLGVTLDEAALDRVATAPWTERAVRA